MTITRVHRKAGWPVDDWRREMVHSQSEKVKPSPCLVLSRGITRGTRWSRRFSNRSTPLLGGGAVSRAHRRFIARRGQSRDKGPTNAITASHLSRTDSHCLPSHPFATNKRLKLSGVTKNLNSVWPTPWSFPCSVLKAYQLRWDTLWLFWPFSPNSLRGY